MTYDKIEARVIGLQALDVRTETYGSEVPVFMTKIPEDTRLLVGRESKNGKWDLSEILQLLRNEVEQSATKSSRKDVPENLKKRKVTQRMWHRQLQ